MMNEPLINYINNTWLSSGDETFQINKPSQLEVHRGSDHSAKGPVIEFSKEVVLQAWQFLCKLTELYINQIWSRKGVNFLQLAHK